MSKSTELMHMVTSALPLASSAGFMVSFFFAGGPVQQLLVAHGIICALCVIVAFYRDAGKNLCNLARMVLALVLSGYILLPSLLTVIPNGQVATYFSYAIAGLVACVLAAALWLMTMFAIAEYEHA